nr:AAA family ATPase [Brachyspira aalborgi]
MNEKLKDKVSKRFNELYFQALGTQEYSFDIKLEKDQIYLSMRKNGNIITLAQQSVGFKWFFNFFFNFLYTNELKAGDIVLMDEPEIHLSIPGRRDLRKFIKKFAKDTGITFIATTHNPSFVDIDYLDELRIIKNNKDGRGVKIQSNFSALADDEVDTLDSIINSFGILRIDLTREYKIIFVEGITDYNYLTAFKWLYNKNEEESKKLNIAFIPIYGLGKDDNEMKKKLDKLIQFKDAILLTDGDTRGNAFKKLCADEKLKDMLTVIQLTEIENSFKNIENLFAQSDKEKFKDIIENKGIEKSSPFKNSIAQLELYAKTIENFNKVLKYLNEMS